MWTPEHIEATLFLLGIFIALFLGGAFSVQAVSCRHSERLGMTLVSAALLAVGFGLIMVYFF